MAKKIEIERKIDEFRDKIWAIQKAIQQIKRTGISEDILYMIIQKSGQRFLHHKF